ncbi:hypothetical protein [Streptacidiphilus sp. MAP5-52]|uniref:hypothetical protein n=1 Tax=Streptacidiphilus sp. MAP5-52 TaxID=3156267 RepID=UPI0035134533
MIDPMDWKKLLEQILHDTASSVTDATGHFTQREHEAALERYFATTDLDPALRSLIFREASQQSARKWSRRRRPRRDKDGNVLYHPDCVFQLGGGDRVWMSHATPEDGTAAALLSSLNRARVNLADDRFQLYINQRLLVFRRYPNLRTWDQVEREAFGYVDTQLTFEDTDNDEDF